MSKQDKIIFDTNPINNVKRWDRKFLLGTLLRSTDLKDQWTHTLKMILNPKVISQIELTYLMEAAYWGDEQMVDILLAHGVDINIRRKTEVQDTALSIALYYKKVDVANALLARNPDLMQEKNPQSWDEESILLWALKNKHDAIVRYMIRHNISVNEKDDIDGRTPLMYAAFYGDMTVIHRLLELKADADMQDAEGYKASDYARGGEQVEAMNFLMAKETPASPVTVPILFTAPSFRARVRESVNQAIHRVRQPCTLM